MSKPLTVYWSHASFDNDMDWQLMSLEPQSLRDHVVDNRNKSNMNTQTFLKCPAVTDLISNVFVWRSPVKTGVQLTVKDGMVSHNIDNGETQMFPWHIEHPPTISNNILVTMKHHIIFFAEEDIEVMLTAPFFNQASHLQYGAIIPGKFNCGAWFRPINVEMNLWNDVREIHFEKDEPISYFTFLTDRKIILKRFNMTVDLHKKARACGTSATWSPRTSLMERYDRFRKTGMRNSVLKEIKNNLV